MSKKGRLPFFSARGLLARALVFIPLHAVLLWWLAGKNIVAALLAPSAEVGRGTAAVAVTFALVRFATVYVVPGLIAACLVVMLVQRLRRAPAGE